MHTIRKCKFFFKLLLRLQIQKKHYFCITKKYYSKLNKEIIQSGVLF